MSSKKIIIITCKEKVFPTNSNEKTITRGIDKLLKSDEILTDIVFEAINETYFYIIDAYIQSNDPLVIGHSILKNSFPIEVRNLILQESNQPFYHINIDEYSLYIFKDSSCRIKPDHFYRLHSNVLLHEKSLSLNTKIGDIYLFCHNQDFDEDTPNGIVPNDDINLLELNPSLDFNKIKGVFSFSHIHSDNENSITAFSIISKILKDPTKGDLNNLMAYYSKSLDW